MTGGLPLEYLYSTEILNYQIRTFGMGLNTFTIFGSGITFAETKGKTLEDIDEIIEGVKHSEAPNVQLAEQGKVDL
ncbi:unnamed protein product [Clonostachys chloroleuca]|uniref:Uncharacterized protein n=1 Tax=Clonostachys chloroleuca TaxID=1926264 RepID=A0AA35PWT2_9HYPO|nr:unnamed protein product [Clonostachys chloroleuca]